MIPSWPDSPLGGTLGDGRHAHATDRPGSADELREAVAGRVAQGFALYPQGGRTALDYGGPPREPGVALDTGGLCRVVDYPAADMTITVEAGITLRSLREVLDTEGQRLLIEAPQDDRATVGGVFATNTCGPRRFGSGRPRDQVLGLSFVNGAGELISGGGRVVKNVAGYDLPRLLTGSLGTLGVLTRLTLKVRPKPEASALVWVTFATADSLSVALDRLNTSATRPNAVEVLNRAAAEAIGGPLRLPAADWVLALGFEDNAPSVAWQVDRLGLELGRTDFVIEQGAEAEPLWQALTESQAATPGPVSLTASLRPSSVVRFLAGFDPGSWVLQAHAGNGIARAHALGTPTLDEIAPVVDRLRAEATRDGGSLTVPRCPTDWKPRLKVWGDPRADWALAERIKRALDPRGVMNPGRFVGTI